MIKCNLEFSAINSVVRSTVKTSGSLVLCNTGFTYARFGEIECNSAIRGNNTDQNKI